MKDLLQTLTNFIKEDFDLPSYAWASIFLIITIFFNYKYNFEDIYIDQFHDKSYYSLIYFAFYAFAFYSVCLPIVLIRKRKDIIFNSSFWKNSLLILFISTIVTVLNIEVPSSKWFNHPHEIYYVDNLLKTSSNFLLSLVLIPVLMFITNSNEKFLYGLTLKGLSLKPYGAMLIIMLPLLAWASYQTSFQQQYPMMKFWLLDKPFGLDTLKTGIIYEILYCLSFIGTEVIFRGAIIIGISKLIGKNVLLPAITVYAFLHFGKPMPETIGSIFGGYILGIIAFKKKNLMGGVAIHIGVALIMDLLAIAQHYNWMPQ